MIFNSEQLTLSKRFLRLEMRHFWVVFVRSLPSALIWFGIISWFLK